jgi:hypothetical protein
MPYRMYVRCQKKSTWGLLGARWQNLSRLRVEKLGCAGTVARSLLQLRIMKFLRARPCLYIPPRLATACHWHAPLGCKQLRMASTCQGGHSRDRQASLYREALQTLSPSSRLALPCLPIAIIAACTHLLRGLLLYAATQGVLKCGLVWPVACGTA